MDAFIAGITRNLVKEKLRKILEPYLIVLNSLPKIALGPMIILWVGSGSKSTIVMCILICVIITSISMLNAFISCDNDKILLMKSMHANKLQILFKLILCRKASINQIAFLVDPFGQTSVIKQF